MEVIIISEELFKESSPVTTDTNIADFVPYLNIAQRIYIEPVLGKALLDELKQQVKAASTTPPPTVNPITPENQALLQLIAPPLSFYAVYQGLPFHWAAIVNKGVTIRESENSKGVALNDIAQLRRWVKDDAFTLIQRLIDYLCECKSSYPLWTPPPACSCGESKNGKNSAPLDAGIYVPNY